MISERLRYSLHLEQDYLLEHPECDNVEVFFPFYETSQSIYYISRLGCSIFRFDKLKKRFNSCKLLRKTTPAMMKKHTMAYIEFNVHSAHFYIHKVVAKLFVDNQNVFATEVDHKNGDMYYNNAFNLEWVTPEENCRRRWFSYYLNKYSKVPEHLQTESNYMSYLNSKKHAAEINKFKKKKHHS